MGRSFTTLGSTEGTSARASTARPVVSTPESSGQTVDVDNGPMVLDHRQLVELLTARRSSRMSGSFPAR
jgi:hypothetical protein